MSSTQARHSEQEIEELRLRLAEAEQTLEAIRAGEVDSLVVEGPDGPRVYSLEGASNIYRVLMESLGEGAATLNEDGVVLYSNGRFARMLDTPLERVIGNCVRDLVPARLHAELDALLRSAFEGESRAELCLRSAGGEELPVYLAVNAIEDQGRRVLCLVATDLREQKRHEATAAAERALREADRLKNEFLAVLSHELRNPLAPIKMGLYILNRVPPGSEQARRSQGVIERQVTQLERLVGDLLDATRISTNKMDLKIGRLDLNELVRAVVEDHRALFEECGVALHVESAPAEVFVDADATRLAQVVGNLLQNAAKFTRSGGSAQVCVATSPEGKKALVRVADTGMGIEPEMLPHLFEPFSQADRTLDRSRGGLGLGLALVKRVVEMHGGEVGAKSEGLGRGAEFVVFLPLAKVAAAQPESPAEPRILQSHRILIIEDSVDGAESLRELLKLFGHEVRVAFSGPEGLDLARRFNPEVVLCDIGLPGMDGYGVARAFRSDEALKHTYLVALSGYALPDDRRHAAEAGFNKHLAKPPSLEQLQELLGKYEKPVG